MSEIQQVQGLQGFVGLPGGVGQEMPSFAGGALERLNGAPAGAVNPLNPTDMATGLSSTGLSGALAQGMQALMGTFGQAMWDQKISKESQEVLALQDSQSSQGANPQEAAGPGAAAKAENLQQATRTLSNDYQAAQSRQIHLSDSTNQLAQKALGLDQNAQSSPNAQNAQNTGLGSGGDTAATDTSGGGGAGSAGGSGGGSSPSTSSASPNSASGGSASPGYGAASSGGAGTSSSGGSGSSPAAAAGGWGAGQDAHLQQALNAPPGTFNNEFAGFDQTVEGNCASVAVMKSAMDVYGNHVFDQVQRDANGNYHVTMQDGYETTVSPTELAQASEAGRFGGNDSDARSYATLMYASMAKRAADEGYDGKHDYQSVLHSFGQGMNPNDSARFLGLKDQIQPLDAQHLQGQNAAVAWNSRHAVYVDSTSQGERSDHYGQAVAYDGTDTKGRELTHAFTFRPRSASGPSEAASTQSVRPSESVRSENKVSGPSASRPSSPRGQTSAPSTRTVAKPHSRPAATRSASHPHTTHHTVSHSHSSKHK